MGTSLQNPQEEKSKVFYDESEEEYVLNINKRKEASK
jgi:hypothetical protein